MDIGGYPPSPAQYDSVRVLDPRNANGTCLQPSGRHGEHGVNLTLISQRCQFFMIFSSVPAQLGWVARGRGGLLERDAGRLHHGREVLRPRGRRLG